MMTNKKRIFSIFLGSILVFTICILTGGSRLYADHWADKEIKSWNDRGLISSEERSNFRANDRITRAEFMNFINKIQGYTTKSSKVNNYVDVNKNDKYYDAIAIALNAGYINGTSDNTMSPNGLITREEAMAIMMRISNVSENSTMYKNAKDSSFVSDWAKTAVSTCINEGFISGDNGNINPLSNMTRAEALVMLNRKLEDKRVYSIPGDYNLHNASVNDILIMDGDVKLKSASVKNYVVLDENVTTGLVRLDNIVVNKDIISKSDSEVDLVLDDVKINGIIKLDADDSDISLIVEGSTKVKKVDVDGAKLIENKTSTNKAIEKVVLNKDTNKWNEIKLKGDFLEVENNVEDLEIIINGDVDDFVVNKDTVFYGDAEINKLDVSKSAVAKVRHGNDLFSRISNSTKKLTINDKGIKSRRYYDYKEIDDDFWYRHNEDYREWYKENYKTRFYDKDYDDDVFWEEYYDTVDRGDSYWREYLRDRDYDEYYDGYRYDRDYDHKYWYKHKESDFRDWYEDNYNTRYKKKEYNKSSEWNKYYDNLDYDDSYWREYLRDRNYYRYYDGRYHDDDYWYKHRESDFRDWYEDNHYSRYKSKDYDKNREWNKYYDKLDYSDRYWREYLRDRDYDDYYYYKDGKKYYHYKGKVSSKKFREYMKRYHRSLYDREHFDNDDTWKKYYDDLDDDNDYLIKYYKHLYYNRD